MTPAYRVIEVSPVTAEELTDILNTAAADGWTVGHVDYIKETGVRRPQMAYVYLIRTAEDD